MQANDLVPRVARRLLLGLAVLVLAGCSTLIPQTVALRTDWPAGVPQQVELAQVPFFPQNIGPQVPRQITNLLGPGLADKLEEPLLQLYVEEWNGFLKQRQRLVDGMAGISDVVVLTGDVHQSFAAEIPVRPSSYLMDRKSAAVEYVTPGVASPSLQTMVNQVAPGVGSLLDLVLTTNNALSNPWVKYAEGFRTGCMVVDFSTQRVQADWYLVDQGTDPSSPVRHVASRQTVAGSRRVTVASKPLT